MKAILCLIFAVCLTGSVLAETNYVLYTTDGAVQEVGKTYSYNPAKGSLQIDDRGMSGLNWSALNFGYTTNDLPDPFSNTNQVTCIRLLPQTEAERQAAKSDSLKQAENKFILISQQLTGQKVKAPMESLTTAVESMQATDPMTAIAIALRLLALDSQLKREAGNLWWDDCVWHDDLVSPSTPTH